MWLQASTMSPQYEAIMTWLDMYVMSLLISDRQFLKDLKFRRTKTTEKNYGQKQNEIILIGTKNMLMSKTN